MNTIHLADEEYTFIRAEATAKGIPDTAYIRSMIVSQACLDALNRVNQRAPGQPFDLPVLFGTDWEKFRPFAASIGKAFCDIVCNGTVSNVKFLGKNGSSGNAQYERV